MKDNQFIKVKFKDYGGKGNVVYSMDGVIYEEKPKHSYVRYYLYDVQQDLYYAILQKVKFKLTILLVILIVGCCLMYEHIPAMIYDISYNKVTTEVDGYVGLNLYSSDSNKHNARVHLEYDGTIISDEYLLKPGASIGNVKCYLPDSSGSKMCKLVYSVDGRYTQTFDILVIPK